MDMKDQKLATEIAEERMTLIAPLLSQNLDKDSVRLIRSEICERNQISPRTLERYLSSYLRGGFEALKPQSKSAEYKYKIPQDLLDEAIQLRRELPSRSVPTIIKILELEGKAEPGFLKRTTLQDALSRAGYSAAMMSLYNDKGYASQRFQRAHRHDLWQGDIKYGLTLNLGGRPTQTYFSCLIDDATRYILHGEFYGNMEQGIVEDTLQKAMTKFGLPRRLYFDNGTQYRTHWMKRACGLLGIRLLYAKPRNPQGKGKQERFNQTLDAFLAEAALHPPESLQELNTQFNAWLSECYHSRPHSALSTTPEIAFKSDSMPPRFVDKALMARAFLRCETRKADKSGVISFGGKRYDLGVVFAGQQVDVVYDPACTDVLTIESPTCSPFQVHQIVVGEHVVPSPKKREVERIPVDHSRLLDALTEQHREKQRRRAISYTSEIEKG